jgi:hypothetical protein
MKKAFSIVLVFLFTLPCFAQTSWYHYAEEFYFVKEVAVANYGGKNFRYEIAVRSNPSDTLSKVRIHGIGVGKGPDDFLNSAFSVESRKEQEWTIYTVIGTVKPEAVRLWFYAAVNGNGHFYFDDISFYIEDSPGHWQQLILPNHSFEEKKPDIFTGYYVSKRRSPTVQTKLSEEVVKTGKYSLLVTTQHAVPATNISTAQSN